MMYLMAFCRDKTLIMAFRRDKILILSIRILVLSVLTLHCTPLSFAQTSEADCENAQTAVEMNACISARYENADERLNSLYNKLRAQLDEEGQKHLRDAQRAWLKFRDAECLWAADEMRGGTGASLIRGACLADQTAIRADDLELYLNNYSR